MSNYPARTESLRIERTVDARPAVVFDAWTSPEVMRRWWHAAADWSTPEADVDLRVGGSFSVSMRDTVGEVHRGRGTYLIVEPPYRLAWVWDGDGEARTGSRVDLAISASPTGGSVVVLEQTLLPDADASAEFEEGWQRCLDNLERVMAS